jgi:hypothetical protein
MSDMSCSATTLPWLSWLLLIVGLVAFPELLMEVQVGSSSRLFHDTSVTVLCERLYHSRSHTKGGWAPAGK